jgi:hypothetical protein
MDVGPVGKILLAPALLQAQRADILGEAKADVHPPSSSAMSPIYLQTMSDNWLDLRAQPKPIDGHVTYRRHGALMTRRQTSCAAAATAAALGLSSATAQALSAKAAHLDAGCLAKLGLSPPTAFADALAALPNVDPKSAYESSPAYEQRLAAAATNAVSPLWLGRTPDYAGQGLSYNADRQLLTIYPSAFGAGAINFTYIFGLGQRGQDAFTSALAFSLEARGIGTETYEATNGFGAKVTVTRTTREVYALWERHGARGDAQFVGAKVGKPLAEIPLEPEAARSVIERGTVRFLAVPKPPSKATGVQRIAPDFTRPRERVDTISVLIADIQCGYVHDGHGTALAAFAVR